MDKTGTALINSPKDCQEDFPKSSLPVIVTLQYELSP